MKKVYYWWQESNINYVCPYDYPASRVKAATKRIQESGGRFEQNVLSIVGKSTSSEDAARNITHYVQQSVIHNPIFQPSRPSKLYALARKCMPTKDIVNIMTGKGLVDAMFLQRCHLIEDPDILIELGEARCGQCARMLCAAFDITGVKAKTLQLKSHIVTEVFLNNTEYIVDADAFKNGLFIEVAGGLASKKDVLENPYLVDQFKHTGWMFRRDSVYAYNEKTQKPYSGYIDLYSPEVDGQVSAKYGASKVLYPPGVPKWETPSRNITLKANKRMTLEYACEYAERAIGYKIKCGRWSKGYSFDRLIFENLANETSGDCFEIETKERYVEVTISDPGAYYITAASIPYYVEEFPSYIWWSDELMIKVVP